MAIQLDKREEVNGKTTFFVRDGNGFALDAFKEESEAREFYLKCVEREKQGYPKVTILANSSINPEG